VQQILLGKNSMTDKTSSFKVAIAATQKALDTKTKKLSQVKADWALYINCDELFRQRCDANYQLGYQSELAKVGSGSEKEQAKKRSVELAKEIKRLDKLDGLKLIDAELKLEHEIELLTSELRVLNNMSHRPPRYML